MDRDEAAKTIVPEISVESIVANKMKEVKGRAIRKADLELGPLFSGIGAAVQLRLRIADLSSDGVGALAAAQRGSKMMGRRSRSFDTGCEDIGRKEQTHERMKEGSTSSSSLWNHSKADVRSQLCPCQPGSPGILQMDTAVTSVLLSRRSSVSDCQPHRPTRTLLTASLPLSQLGLLLLSHGRQFLNLE